MEAGRPGDALADFRAALAAGAGGRRAEVISSVIQRLESRTGVAGTMTANAERAGTQSAKEKSSEKTDTQRRLSVRVEVKEGLELAGNEKVFVYARALEGPPMPLAVQRLDVSALPGVINLDESMAMMPGMGLANFDKVQVVARISTSGIANVSPDDFQAVSEPVDLNMVDNPTVTLRISERVGAAQ